MPDPFHGLTPDLTSPLIGGFVITPNDAILFDPPTRQIRITGTDGMIAVVWFNGSETVEPVKVGDVFDWRLVSIKATGTTATGIRGYI